MIRDSCADAVDNDIPPPPHAGTDLYVFFIVPDLSSYSADPPALTVDLLLDGGIQQSAFISDQSGAQYTTTGFTIHGLDPNPHTVNMFRATEAANRTYSIVFDYALYTYASFATSSTQPY